MRNSFMAPGLAVMVVLSAQAATAQSRDKAEVALRAAIEKETVEGNLKAAVEEYKKLAQNANKSVAARALVRLGECYEKQGNTEARKTYEQVLSKFADHADAVAQARARLAALGRGRQTGPVTTKLVWGGPKAEVYSISPDGRYVSYTDWDTGNLVLHDLVTGADRALTTDGRMKPKEYAYALRSVISRDGKQIAYGWSNIKAQCCELRVANMHGDPNPRRLLERAAAAMPADWSPDGKWIAVRVKQREGDRSAWQIGLVNAQDGSLRILKSGPEVPFVGGFSPDGKYLVSMHSQPTSGNVRGYILSLDGKSETPLVSKLDLHSPVWAPDGTRIIFGCWSGYSRVEAGLWSVRVADGKPVGTPELLKACGDDARPIGFTLDGSLLYGANSPQFDVYVADLDQASGKLTSQPKRVSQNSWGGIRWLPDGKSLSFWHRREGRDALVAHSLTTASEHELWDHTPGAVGPGYTGWFPDGSLMSYETQGQMLVLRQVDSRSLEAQATWTIPTVPPPTRSFSRDLMTMFFWRTEGAAACEGAKCKCVVVARDVATGRDREILRIDANWLQNLSSSPDGRSLAFVAWSAGENSLMVAPTDGGTPRELYRRVRVVYPGGLTWTADSTHVLAARSEAGLGEIWSFPAAGGAPEKSALAMPLGPYYTSEVSPDGTQIAFVGGELKQEIWSLAGLFSDGKSAPSR